MIPSYILLALLSMVLIGIYDFVYSKAVRKGVSAGTMTCSQACFFVPTVTLWSYLEGTFIYARLTQGGPRFSRQGWAHGFVASFSLSMGLIALLAALKIGEASVVTPIGQLSFVVSALMVTLWMGERFTKRKVAGLLLAVATIVAFLPG